MPAKKPHANTPLADYIEKLFDLSGAADIAANMRFRNRGRFMCGLSNTLMAHRASVSLTGGRKGP
jgi:hypothetical protein